MPENLRMKRTKFQKFLAGDSFQRVVKVTIQRGKTGRGATAGRVATWQHIVSMRGIL
jgi:hypothetical protein